MGIFDNHITESECRTKRNKITEQIKKLKNKVSYLEEQIESLNELKKEFSTLETLQNKLLEEQAKRLITLEKIISDLQVAPKQSNGEIIAFLNKKFLEMNKKITKK